MFEWLDDEIAQINTRKSHLVDGPAPAELRRAVETTEIPLPPSQSGASPQPNLHKHARTMRTSPAQRHYKEFMLRFGDARLYRYSTNYYVTVFAGPRAAEDRHGELLVHIGKTWTSYAYFKEALLVEGKESPVFEYFQNCFRKTANGFEEWLRTKGRSARRRFKNKEPKSILRQLHPRG